MNKKLLRAIPVENATDEIIVFAKALNGSTKLLLTATNAIIEDENIMVANFYYTKDLCNNIRIPKYRVYFSKDNYITQDMQSEKVRWLTGCLDNIFLGDFYYWSDHTFIYSKKSIQIISEFVGKDEDLLNALRDFQDRVMKIRYNIVAQKRAEQMKKIMSTVPELPDDWKDWLEETAVADFQCVFYEYKKTKQPLKGQCTACGHLVLLDNPKPKHNKKGYCPHCKQRITFKASKKKKDIQVSTYTYIIQKALDGSGIWLRAFELYDRYYPFKKRDGIKYWETVRWFFPNDGEPSIYEYSYYENNVLRWGKSRDRITIYPGALYEGNIKSVINGTKYVYSALFEFATHKKGYRFFPHRYIWQYPQKKFIEYLVKLGLYNLVTDVLEHSYGLYINTKGNSLTKILKCDKSLIKLLVQVNACDSDIRFLEFARKRGVFFNSEEYKKYCNYYGHHERLIKATKYTTIYKINKYFDSLSSEQKPQQHCNYYYIQNDAKYSNLATDYCDYLGWCKDLHYDMSDSFVLFPKNFRQAHDETSKTWNEHKSEIDKEKLEKLEKRYMKTIYPKLLKMFNYHSDSLMVVIPTCKSDFTNEGHSLHHCVSGYAERALKGETTILFVRNIKEPEKPFYTCEINKDLKLIQCRGKHNCDMTNKVKSFVDNLIEEAIKIEYAKNLQSKKQCA